MHITNGSLICLGIGIVFLIFGLVYAIFKDKALFLTPGFNILPTSEKRKYDQNQIAIDQRNLYLLYALIFIIGFILSMINGIIAIPTIFIWIFVFIKNTHINFDKAFSKYKINIIKKKENNISYKKIKKHHKKEKEV